MAAPGFGYDQYLQYVEPYMGISGGGDAGFTRDPNYRPMSKEDWDALPLAQKYAMLSGTPKTGSGNGAVDTDFTATPEDQTAFRQKFGDSPWKPDQSGAPDNNSLLWGYGDVVGPYNAKPGEFMIDPSRVLHLPDGRWVIENNNIKGDWLAKQQDFAARGFRNGMYRSAAMLAAAAVGGAAAAGEGAGVGTSVAATDAAESGGSLALNAAGTGTAPYVPTVGEAAVGTGAAAAPAASGAGTSVVPEVTTPVATAPTTSIPGSGIINGARQAGEGAMSWYNGLSPAARFVLNHGVSAGARSLLAANQQRHAIDAATEAQNRQHQFNTEQEARQRADFSRRHSVSNFGDAFKPRGVIDTSRNGG